MLGIDFISGIAIGFAMGITLIIFVSIVKRRKNRSREIPFYEVDKPHDAIEPFIDIPLEKIILKKPKANHSSIHNLKDKLKKFQIRNQFYQRQNE